MRPDSRLRDRPPGRVCVDSINLPSGVLVARHHQLGNNRMLQASFDMALGFRDDDTGCECGRGESLQQLKGRFELDFLGAAVGGADGRRRVSGWHEWTVR